MITPVSARLWKSSGSVSCHSSEEDIWEIPITARCAVKASHNRKIKNKRPTRDVMEPKEETTFHFV